MSNEKRDEPKDRTKSEKPADEEVVNLNAEDLDVQELDDKLLEQVAGGSASCVDDDGCTNNVLC